jgi:MoxR-like ATPase
VTLEASSPATPAVSADHLHRPLLEQLAANLAAVILGKAEVIEQVLVALACGGNILLEDVPGIGKTTLAKALAKSLQAQFHRIQFTPDMLPADILGGSIYNPQTSEFIFRPGPVFCNVLLADEINRASPRTQSALLEAMSEAQATVEGLRHPLPQPFIVIATQNPIEFHGTYPLPEAQLDRFMVRLELGYPAEASELDMLYAQQRVHPLESLNPVADCAGWLALQQAVRAVGVERSVGRYVIDLVRATRTDSRLQLGASPRAATMLFHASQGLAYVRGRHHVLPDDVREMAPNVLAHRLVIDTKAQYSGLAKSQLVREIIDTVPIPV